MDNYIEEAKKIIAENIYMTISTVSTDGTPWISPVFYGFDEDYNFYWISDKDARHSELVRSNPNIALVIFNSQAPEGEGDGVYIEAEAYELNDEEQVMQGIKIRDNRAKVEEYKVKKIVEVMGNGQWRVYKATPKSVSKLTEGTSINGQYVDKRVEISLK